MLANAGYMMSKIPSERIGPSEVRALPFGISGRTLWSLVTGFLSLSLFSSLIGLLFSLKAWS